MENNAKNDLILFKDESNKAYKNNKMKYLLKAIPDNNGKTNEDPYDALISFSETSTKVPDRPHQDSMMKKNSFDKIEYFKKQFEEGGKLYTIKNNYLDFPTSLIITTLKKSRIKEVNHKLQIV